MSQRLGMADGRCITSYDSSRIMNDVLMSQRKIAFQDNYTYRRTLQSEGPVGLNLPLSNAACRSPPPKPLIEDE